jgi:hypothetical protein
MKKIVAVVISVIVLAGGSAGAIHLANTSKSYTFTTGHDSQTIGSKAIQSTKQTGSEPPTTPVNSSSSPTPTANQTSSDAPIANASPSSQSSIESSNPSPASNSNACNPNIVSQWDSLIQQVIANDNNEANIRSQIAASGNTPYLTNQLQQYITQYNTLDIQESVIKGQNPNCTL